ncbi:hypothetical protein [Anaerocolumna xylanovorans]|uniref:Tautomerase enzyme n=1 Tax=Anaerocolumna xylanovorans DSM 12503 TaxID=1121345 RepID=A0A1M7YEG7_9FIRM|nr:hypothetical protein [Anaerocolumna xylanovorans]SHO50976.1 hypothetical protein SAMN02745217_02995 [Anaerocolumna xylanovorans DSM 12503]
MPIIKIYFTKDQINKSNPIFYNELGETASKIFKTPYPNVRIYVNSYENTCNQDDNSAYVEVNIISQKTEQQKKIFLKAISEILWNYFGIEENKVALVYILLMAENCVAGGKFVVEHQKNEFD